ncbi:MAG: chaperone NapD [Myxococcales bacterium]|nr:chaperone NapD [Myxococcota bacterium]MDW8282263.1 chaperone NapD [Myxococcales bacterium]
MKTLRTRGGPEPPHRSGKAPATGSPVGRLIASLLVDPQGEDDPGLVAALAGIGGVTVSGTAHGRLVVLTECTATAFEALFRRIQQTPGVRGVSLVSVLVDGGEPTEAT